MPVGTPVAMCSARRVSCANSEVGNSQPSANATAISSAALDDKPAPTGIVVVTCPEIPRGESSSDATAPMYLPHVSVIAASNVCPSEMETVPSSSAESRTIPEPVTS